MGQNNSTVRKAERKADALIRNDAWQRLHIEDKVAELITKRPGKSNREANRLLAANPVYFASLF